MLQLLRHLARTLLPPAIRTPLADRVYASITLWRNTSARGVASLARLRRALTPPQSSAAASPDRPADGPPNTPLRRLARRGRAVLASARAAGAVAAQRLVAKALPLVWARPPLSLRTRVTRPVVMAGLRVLDDAFERRFAALVSHALEPRPPHTGRPRVCLMIGTLGPGGAERQATNTLIGLREHYELDQQVVASFQDQEWQRFFAPTLRGAGIPVDAVRRDGDPLAVLAGCGHPDAPALARAIGRTLPASLHDVALYTRELLLRSPDIAHLWLDEVNVRAGLAALLTGVPRTILSTRSINPSNFPLFQPYMRAGYRVLSGRPQVALLNNSETGARDYERWIGLPGLSCTVLRNGFDFDRLLPDDAGARGAAIRTRLGFAEGDLVVGGMMRFSEEKRPLLWLEAAAQVLTRHPAARLVLVGDGVLRPEVEALAARPPLAGRVVLPGHDKQPYDTMSAMNVLFLSSIHEGLPNVLIEAQALGVPVVTMRAGGAVETLRDGDTGWIVQGTDAAAAARVIGDALADPEALRAAGRRGRAFARQQFGYRRMLDETARIYGRVPRRTGPQAHARAVQGGEIGHE